MKIATVKSDGLNLRQGPGPDYPWTDKLTTGDRLTVSNQSGKWLYGEVTHTKTGIGVGEKGWFHSNYVSIELKPDPMPAEDMRWLWAVGVAFVALVSTIVAYAMGWL